MIIPDDFSRRLHASEILDVLLHERWRASRLRKNPVGTTEFHWSARLVQQEDTLKVAQKGWPARPQQAKNHCAHTLFGTGSL
jgi:hypothetical protein